MTRPPLEAIRAIQVAPAADIRAIQFGLGPIGRAALRRALGWRGIKVVGCVEQDATAVAETTATVLGDPRFARVPIRPDLATLLAEVGPADVVLHAAVSTITQALPQLLELVDAGLNVITLTEELICPGPAAAPIVRRLDDLARRRGITIFPTGVNPGFVLDRFILGLTAVCARIQHIEGRRLVECSTRRRRLQEKLGVGQDPERVREGIAARRMGHVGLAESLHLIGRGLGWVLDDTEVAIEPIEATSSIDRGGLRIEAGQVAGIHHEAWGSIAGTEVLHLVLRMSVDVEHPCDSIRIAGEPNLRVDIPGGVAGDIATVGALLNAVPYVVAAPPGLHALPPGPRYWDSWQDGGKPC
jgi:4-hydroxy-tetrahydrodipicolinate reductase